MVGQYAGTDNTTGQNAGVAFLYIFLAFYAVGIDVGTYIYLGEMFPNHIRVKGVGLSLATLNVAGAIYLSITGVVFEEIGWKFFLVRLAQSTQHRAIELMKYPQVFAAITFVGMIWVAIFLPETRLLPLEEIEALFGNTTDTMVFITPGAHSEENKLSGGEMGNVEQIER